MAHFGILTPPDAGHLFPLGAIGRELEHRGHKITVITRAKAGPFVEELKLGFHPLDIEKVPWPSAFLLWAFFSIFGQGWKIGFRNSFIHNADGVLQVVPDIVKELALDGLIGDQVIAAGGTAAERAGVPFVTVCTAPPWNEDPAQPPPFTLWPYKTGLLAQLRNRYGYLGWRWFIGPTLKTINRYRRAWGMRRYRNMEESYSPLAQVSQLFPEFDFPRSTLPDCFHYVGCLTVNRPDSCDGFPWEKLDGRPIILASLGTIADPMNRPVYPKIAAACAGLPAQLVLARGKWDGEDGGREATHELPGDPLVVDFVPQLPLLERAAMMITHAGLNTVLESISRGVPMVAMPRNADQPGNAARIVHSGAGLCAPFHHGTPEELRGVIERVLTDDKFRHRAEALRQAMPAAGGPQRAAEIIEQALLTRRPVLRQRKDAGIEVWR